MITQNCVTIGSLVHRAQGYKKLKEEMAANTTFYVSQPTSRNHSYFLVCEKHRAYAQHNNSKVILDRGTIVKFVNNTRRPTEDLEVKVIDIHKKVHSSEDIIYRCTPEKFIPLDEKVCHLIAAIESPDEKLRIAKDFNLCRELCSIDKGCVVKVLPNYLGIVLSKRTIQSDGMGVVFDIFIQDLLEKKPMSSKHKLGNTVTKTPECLRLLSHNQSLSTCFDEVDYICNNEGDLNIKQGDKVVWCPDEQPPSSGTVCWNCRISDNVRLHLENNTCKEVNCDRSKTISVPTRELMLEQEFSRRCEELSEKGNQSSGTYSRRSEDMSYFNDAKIANLLGLDEEYNGSFSNFNLKSPSKYSEYLTGEEKVYKSDKNYSTSNSSRKLESSQSYETLNNVDDLGIGSVVEVPLNDKPHYGVIKWIGIPKFQNASNILIAGIELEEEDCDAGDGCMQGQKYFDCAPHKGCFVLLKNCKKDSRFSDSYLIANDIQALNSAAQVVIPGILKPIDYLDNERMFKKYNGIQGHNNSCYLDATLFSMFTFTSVFDSLLLRPRNTFDDDCYEEVQRVLREEIVNPLRKNLFVHADSVMKLRTLLDNSTSVTGLTCEEKDPEEFLTSLVAQVLKAEPFLKLSSGHEAYYYQLFVEKDEHLVLPSVQQLFEQSLTSSDIKLKEVPSCLIIQMPRFGKSYKMYPRILPSQMLDVTNVIENSPRECSVCGELAKYECKDCFKHHNKIPLFSFCEACVITTHNHEDRRGHKPNILQIPRECASFSDASCISHQYMELFAVLCIETSHYVAFVKCGSGPDTPWCFFDSMADRKGELNGFNIPEMVLCSDLPKWLSDENAQTFSEIKDDRNLPTYAKRLLCDAYMCMYQSTDVMMYR